MNTNSNKVGGPETKVLMHASNFRAVKNIPVVIQVFAEVRKRLQAKLISMTCDELYSKVQKNGARISTLAAAADVALDCSIAQEACSLGLAPTASSLRRLLEQRLGEPFVIEKAPSPNKTSAPPRHRFSMRRPKPGRRCRLADGDPYGDRLKRLDKLLASKASAWR